MLLKTNRFGLYIFRQHICYQLIRYLLEHFLCQLLGTILNVFLEFDKLDDISAGLVASGISQ